jgi:CrcB protein
MVVVLDLTSPHRLVRPFLGVGVLGGFTTYSTFAVDVQVLVLAHQLVTALAYIGATLATCTLAVWLAVVITQNVAQLVVTRRLRHRDDPRRTR